MSRYVWFHPEVESDQEKWKQSRKKSHVCLLLFNSHQAKRQFVTDLGHLADFRCVYVRVFNSETKIGR